MGTSILKVISGTLVRVHESLTLYHNSQGKTSSVRLRTIVLFFYLWHFHYQRLMHCLQLRILFQVGVPLFSKAKLAVNVFGVRWFLENLTNPAALQAANIKNRLSLVTLLAQLSPSLWAAGRDVGKPLASEKLLFLSRKDEGFSGIFIG